MQDLIQIEFVRKFNMYGPGVKAGFPPSIAEKLIKDGVATLVTVKPSLENRVQTKIIKK